MTKELEFWCIGYVHTLKSCSQGVTRNTKAEELEFWCTGYVHILEVLLPRCNKGALGTYTF